MVKIADPINSNMSGAIAVFLFESSKNPVSILIKDVILL
jgi:hypothetical protein